ncbi:hypothetical protein RJ639_044269 [Escallonia herrerae]|uniref:Beta-1,3-glucanase n=1 Tax=Escallonia herrerae TaxID=1293975 RepID=A0AA88WFR2_9ASTE|nr:hypothetical protein RJ639_044269 [Escallonia herrerae]
MSVSSFSFPFSLLVFSLLTTTTTFATTIGVTYNPTATLPSPEHVAGALQTLKIPAVRLPQPDPSVVRAFSYCNTSLLLTVPNSLVPSFAANRSAAELWLYTHVVPFHPRARISAISVGSDAPSDASDLSSSLLPAIRNLHSSLSDLGLRHISVSTTFSFINTLTTSFPPPPPKTNSSFLINLYPYNVYKLNSEIPIGYALFQEQPFNFRDDHVTGVRYRNLFDMMVDAVVAAMAVSGHENIPIIVTETGWPSSASGVGNTNDGEASQVFAEMYLKGLLLHLNSGLGTPLRKEGVAEAYIYQLFDNSTEQGSNVVVGGSEQRWGIVYPNMTMKYRITFSGVSGRVGGAPVGMVIGVVLVVGVLLFQKDLTNPGAAQYL